MVVNSGGGNSYVGTVRFTGVTKFAPGYVAPWYSSNCYFCVSAACMWGWSWISLKARMMGQWMVQDISHANQIMVCSLLHPK